MAQMNYQNKQMLMGAMVVAGYDSVAGGQVSRAPSHMHTPAPSRLQQAAPACTTEWLSLCIECGG
jgi:hypothetical protein